MENVGKERVSSLTSFLVGSGKLSQNPQPLNSADVGRKRPIRSARRAVQIEGEAVSNRNDRRGGRWMEWGKRRKGEATSLEVVGRTRRMEDGLGSVAQEAAPME